MKMENREIRYYTTAAMANIMQLVICFIAYFVGLFLNINNALLALILIIAEIGVWAICGFRLSMTTRIGSPVKLVGATLIALFPILFYTVLALLINANIPTDSQGWGHFFFIGGPLIFFNRPSAILVNMFKGDAYTLFFVNYAIIAASYLAGGLFGYAISAPGANRREKRQKKEEKKKEKAEKKKARKEEKKNRKKKTENEEAQLKPAEEAEEAPSEEPKDYTEVSDSEMERLEGGEELEAVKELENIDERSE